MGGRVDRIFRFATFTPYQNIFSFKVDDRQSDMVFNYKGTARALFQVMRDEAYDNGGPISKDITSDTFMDADEYARFLLKIASGPWG